MNGLLRHCFAIITICAPCIVLTGCGGEDNDSSAPDAASANRESVIHAPERLNGNGYTLRGVEDTYSTFEFDANADTYRYQANVGILETGSFMGQRNGDVWNVEIIRDGTTNATHLDLTFASSTEGTFSWNVDGTVYTGTFAPIGTTPAPPVRPGDPEPNPGPDPIQPPESISAITITVGPGAGIAAGTVYTVSFSGDASGTFTASDTHGNTLGSGTYTYTPTGNQAALNMNYTSSNLVPDQDRMNLIYFYPPGTGQPNQFTGTQIVSGSQYPFNGTFTY